jgi:AraC-like DNA-binding protein
MGKEQLTDIIFEVIEISQSLIMGLFMLILSIKRTRSWSYLGVFLILFSFSSIFDLYVELNSSTENSIMLTLSNSLLFIVPTAYYRYVHSLLIVPYHKTLRGFRWFGITFFLLGVITSFTGIMTLDSLFYEFYGAIASFYLLLIFITIGLQVYRHNKLLKQQYSNLEHRELTWVFYFTLLLISTLFIVPFLSSFVMTGLSDFWENMLFSLFSIVWLLGIIYNGLFYQFSTNYLPENKNEKRIKEKSPIKIEIEEKDEKEDISETVNKLNEQLSTLFRSIKNVLQEKTLYLNTELTIADIASYVNAHPKTASQAINQFSGQNFSNFVNAYRVEYAVKLLMDQKYKNISIEGIGNKAGFKSNSVFYTAFKKKMLMTPLQYQKKMIENTDL